MDHQDFDKNPPENELVVSWCGQNLKKIIPQLYKRPRDVTELHLDNNEILKLEQLDRMPFIREFTMSHNQLTRMYPVHNLKYLKKLDLSYNCILMSEGLRMLFHLEYLNLAGNKIKCLERLQSNLMLEYIDLSENLLVSLPNVSELNKLKILYLHKNKINNLKSAELCLPKSLTTLTLAENKIQDLTEVSCLAHLPNLVEISFINNPCVDTFNRSPIEFDFRPYLINWCRGLEIIDGYAVDDLERLKAEWLYSQGKGRKFKPGQHAELVDYLMEILPVTSRKLLSDKECKLRLILSKAHQHQRQLEMDEQLTADKRETKEFMSRSLDSSLTGIECSSRERLNTSDLKQDMSSLTRSFCDSTNIKPLTCDELRASTSKANASLCSLPDASKLVRESLVNPQESKLAAMTASLEDVIAPDQILHEKLRTITQDAQLKREKERESDNKDASHVRRSAWNDTSDEVIPEPSSSKAIIVQHSVLNEPQISSVEELLLSNIDANDVTPAPNFQAASEISTCTQHTEAKFPRQFKNEEESDVVHSDSLQEILRALKIFLISSDHRAFLRVSKSGTSSLIENKTTSIPQKSLVENLGQIFLSSNDSFGTIPLQDQEQSDLIEKIKIPISPVKISNERTKYILMPSSHMNGMNKEMAAVCIQKYWRGYLARKNFIASSLIYHVHTKRTIQHIKKISQEVEIMRVSLDNGHRIQILQMQAIRALWAKVHDLQGCMQELIDCVTPTGSGCASMSTQTDITSVHSPTLKDNKSSSN